MGESFQADPTPVVAYTVVIHLEVYANSCRQGKRCRCQLDEDCGPENTVASDVADLRRLVVAVILQVNCILSFNAS